MAVMKRDKAKIDAGCMILAGGEGRRLSPDKPLLEVDGLPIIERVCRVVEKLFAKIVIVTNTPEKYEYLGIPCVADLRPGCGPLMGIYSGFQALGHETVFACAADMPFVQEDIVRAEFEEIAGCDVLVPYPDGYPEFLHAFYRQSCMPIVKRHLDAGIYKIDSLHESCNIKHLKDDWFALHEFTDIAGMAFVNINKPTDYERWRKGKDEQLTMAVPDLIEPALLAQIKRQLVENETLLQNESAGVYDSLWHHSLRVAQIARFLASKDDTNQDAAFLAGLLHDLGKFAGGKYHVDNVAEEELAAQMTESLLKNTRQADLIPAIQEGLLSLYREDVEPGGVGRVLYDADRLDKLGNMGVAQFFAKNALRRKSLGNDLFLRASIELTYAHHAPHTLKTPTGRKLAETRAARVDLFYRGLMEEWQELGLGSYSIRMMDVGGVEFVLVFPEQCACGSRLDIHTDIKDSVKCRSAQVSYQCPNCNKLMDFSFCLPNIKGLPPRQEKSER